MRILRHTSEADMVAAFLRGEYDSARFGKQVKDALDKFAADPKIITQPDLRSGRENALRRAVLHEARGYGSATSWFAGMPEHVEWYRAELAREELPNIRYIVYSYWIELTGGTLRAGDAVPTIEHGTEIFHVSNKPFLRLSKAIADGHVLPPMIIVGTGPTDLVVLEGHARLTGYVLAGKKAPATLEVILGLSPDFTKWKMYSYAAYDRHR